MLVQSFCWQYCLPSYLWYPQIVKQCKTNLKQVHKKVKKITVFAPCHKVSPLFPVGQLAAIGLQKMWSHSLWADRMERVWRTQMQTDNKR